MTANEALATLATRVRVQMVKDPPVLYPGLLWVSAEIAKLQREEAATVGSCPSCDYLGGPCQAHLANAAEPDAAFTCDRPPLAAESLAQGFVRKG